MRQGERKEGGRKEWDHREKILAREKEEKRREREMRSNQKNEKRLS